jgi:hypothetical protein
MYRIRSFARWIVNLVEVGQVGWIHIAAVELALPLLALLNRCSIFVFRFEVSIHSLHQCLVLVDEALNLVTGATARAGVALAFMEQGGNYVEEGRKNAKLSF